MIETDPLAEIKKQLLAAWDSPEREEEHLLGEARFESLSAPRRPRGGFAIGHSIDPRTRETRLELRVTADAGPNRKKAEKIEKLAWARGFEAELIVSGKPRVVNQRAPLPKLPDRQRPLHLGASVAHQQAAAGTLGAFVQLPDGKTGIVSCGHVLARLSPSLRMSGRKKWGRPRDPVHQPAWPDQDPVLAGDRIGDLHDFAPFIAAQQKNLDAAVARLDDEVEYQGNVIPDLPCVPAEFKGRLIGQPLPAAELVRDLRVVKLGRTTGFTEATLRGISYQNVRVEFETGGVTESFTFFDVHEVIWDAGWEDDEKKRYAAPGDSGSLVMSREGLQPIGLHFTSVQRRGHRASFVVPWRRIEGALKVNLKAL